MAVFCSFSSSSRPETGSGFCSSARLPGPPPPQIMRWQTGPLYNRSGVEPVRLNTVYAFNRPLLPAGLEPGTSPTIPSRQDLPAPSYSPPSTCKHVGSPVWSTTIRLVKQLPQHSAGPNPPPSGPTWTISPRIHHVLTSRVAWDYRTTPPVPVLRHQFQLKLKLKCRIFFHWDVLSLGTFCPLGRFVSWDILSLGTFCPWDILSLGRFVSWDVLSLEPQV